MGLTREAAWKGPPKASTECHAEALGAREGSGEVLQKPARCWSSVKAGELSVAERVSQQGVNGDFGQKGPTDFGEVGGFADTAELGMANLGRLRILVRGGVSRQGKDEMQVPRSMNIHDGTRSGVIIVQVSDEPEILTGNTRFQVVVGMKPGQRDLPGGEDEQQAKQARECLSRHSPPMLVDVRSWPAHSLTLPQKTPKESLFAIYKVLLIVPMRQGTGVVIIAERRSGRVVACFDVRLRALRKGTLGGQRSKGCFRSLMDLF